jgi:hypothetical protein
MDEAQQFVSNFAEAATPQMFNLLSFTFERAIGSDLARGELESLEQFMYRLRPAGAVPSWRDLSALSSAMCSAIFRVQSNLDLEGERFRLSETLAELAYRTGRPAYTEPIQLYDVVPVLGRFGAQLALLKTLELRCPTVSFGPDTVPVSLHVPDEKLIDRNDIRVLVSPEAQRPYRSTFWRRLSRVLGPRNLPVPLTINSVPLDGVAKLMSEPLSRFLGFAYFGRRTLRQENERT